MPKQIMVANKSRKQTVKVNFRQSSLPPGEQPHLEVPGLVIWTQSVVHQNRVHTEECECMTFPGQLFAGYLQLCLQERPV